MPEKVLYAADLEGLSFKDLMDVLYTLTEDSQAAMIKVQYATKLNEMLSWSIDLLDDQDIHDATLFIKAFDLSEDYSHLHSVQFSPYSSIPFDGSTKNWKMGGEHWRADSREKDESVS